MYRYWVLEFTRPLVVERDLTLHIYNNRISEYLVYGNSAF